MLARATTEEPPIVVAAGKAQLAALLKSIGWFVANSEFMLTTGTALSMQMSLFVVLMFNDN
jgi:hypothetical protein